jgi:hypothetical protein
MPWPQRWPTPLINWPRKSRPDGNRTSQIPLHAKQKYTSAIKISMAFSRLFLIGIRSIYLRSNTVRPPDENQNGSTRPNFMSASRRAAGGDDNILARLEKDANRGPSAASWSKHARAWCGLAALAIIGLIGVLASLARENLAAHRPALIEAKAAPDLFANGGFAPLPGPAPSTANSTALVDLPIAPPKSKSSDRDGVPPLVMLKPAPAPVKMVTPVSKLVAHSSAKPATHPSAKTVTQASAKAVTPAARNAPAKLPAKRTPAKPAATPARPALAATAPARAATRTPPRAEAATAPARKKTTSAAAPVKAERAVDSDVALLSAIIMHASRHAAERAQIEAAQCGAGKKCPPSEAAAALKATD